MKHFFFTSWPDHGVPQFATALITFIKRVRQSQPKDTEAPLLVHCRYIGCVEMYICGGLVLNDINIYGVGVIIFTKIQIYSCYSCILLHVN